MTDDKHNTKAEDKIGDDLLAYVCKHYKGPNKSSDCPSETEMRINEAYRYFMNGFGLLSNEKCYK